MGDCKITPAAVRLYGHCLDIECEVEEAIAESMTTSELLALTDRVPQGDLDDKAEEKRTQAILARNPEYQYVKAELGRQLGLGPDDIHPLDVDMKANWSFDDSRMEAQKRRPISCMI